MRHLLRMVLLLSTLSPLGGMAAPPTHLGNIDRVLLQQSMLLGLTGTDTFVTLNQPSAVTAWGNLLYFYDNARQLLYRLEQGSERLTLLQGPLQQLQGIPSAIAASADGTLYIADPVARQILQFDLHGQLMQRYHNLLNLAHPAAIAFSSYGKLLVGDGAYNHAVVFDPSGEAIRAIGRRGTDRGEVMQLVDIASGPDLIYLLDRMPCKVVLFNEAGTLLDETLCRATHNPNRLAVDPYGRIYISDAFDDTIKVYHRNTLLESFGGTGSKDGEFRMVADLEISDNLLYVADSGNNRIQKFLLSAPLYPEKGE